MRAHSHWQLINDGGIEVKQAITTIIAAGLLLLSGCTQPETANTATTPTATPAATVAPTAAAAQSGDLAKAAEDLDKAIRELQDKNYRGALDWINGAHKEVTAVLNASDTPAAVKSGVETANTDLDNVKALVEKKDPTAEKSLKAALAQITKLAERLNAEAAKAAKGAAEKTVPKKQ